MVALTRSGKSTSAKEKKSKISELESTLRRTRKALKTAQAAERRLQQQVSDAQETHTARMREASEDFGRQISNVQKEALALTMQGDARVAEVEQQLEDTRGEVSRLQEVLARIQSDDAIVRAASPALKRHLSFGSEAYEGW
eukprot:UC1_evm1s1224